MRNKLLLIAIFAGHVAIAQNQQFPHLENKDGTIQLMVNDEPFLMLSGEIHNSSAGSAHHMQPLWSRLAKKNLNTIIAPVSWELVEPAEGEYDFSLVDRMISGARNENLKLVIIWFGSWKNGKSMYAPGWVKKDPKRFPLVKDQNGKTLDILSTMGANTLQADARAFSELMKYIKEVDSEAQTNMHDPGFLS